MLTQPTIEKLCAMRLRGMADAFREQQEKADYQQLSFEERLGMLIDRQWHWRENRALDRRLRSGRPAWRILISALRADWTANWSDR